MVINIATVNYGKKQHKYTDIQYNIYITNVKYT